MLLTSAATRISFQMTRSASFKRMSSMAMPRMIRAELWEPQFPLVSISMGIKETSTGIASKATSYFVMIIPVKVAESIKISSQGIRFPAWRKTEVLK